MVAKYVVVVHNRKWGDYYKEFDSKRDAIRYRCEVNCDFNTYAWLYRHVEVTDEMEEQALTSKTTHHGRKPAMKKRDLTAI